MKPRNPGPTQIADLDEKEGKIRLSPALHGQADEQVLERTYDSAREAFRELFMEIDAKEAAREAEA